LNAYDALTSDRLFDKSNASSSAPPIGLPQLHFNRYLSRTESSYS